MTTIGVWETASPEETQDLAERVGRLLAGGEVIALDGDLGAGKTCFVRGLARGLDLDPRLIYSPSFTLVAEHRGRMALNHIDLFRLGEPVSRSESREIGLEDYLCSTGVTVVEWFGKLAPDDATPDLRIAFEIRDADRRVLRIEAGTPRGDSVVQRIRWP